MTTSGIYTYGEPKPAFEPAPETIEVPPTPEAWAALNDEIARLNRQIESYQSRINANERLAREAEDQRSAFKDRLVEAVESEEFDLDLATEFAEIFDITMVKTISVTITAEWSGTVEVGLGIDMDSLEVEVEYPEISYSCDGFENLSMEENSLEVETSDY